MKERIKEKILDYSKGFEFLEIKEKDLDRIANEILDLFSVNKRAFNVTYLANDEIIKGLTVLADSKEEAMHKALLLRDSKDIYSAIEVNVC